MEHDNFFMISTENSIEVEIEFLGLWLSHDVKNVHVCCERQSINSKYDVDDWTQMCYDTIDTQSHSISCRVRSFTHRHIDCCYEVFERNTNALVTPTTKKNEPNLCEIGAMMLQWMLMFISKYILCNAFSLSVCPSTNSKMRLEIDAFEITVYFIPYMRVLVHKLRYLSSNKHRHLNSINITCPNAGT